MCPCEGERAEDLILCLAPPPGEYEVDIPISNNRRIIINTDGVFLRSIIVDDTLPFAKTLDRATDIGILDRIALRIDKREVLCKTVEMLILAAEHGSLAAARKIEECRDLVEKILGECSRT